MENFSYVIALGFNGKPKNEFLHIDKSKKPYFMLGVYTDEFVCYQYKTCALKKARKIRPLFSKDKDIIILKVKNGQRITEGHIVGIL